MVDYTLNGLFEYTRDTSGDGKTIFVETDGADPFSGDPIFDQSDLPSVPFTVSGDGMGGYTVGEDVTGFGNTFFGTVQGSVNGVPTEFILVNGSSGGTPDPNTFLMFIPEGVDPNVDTVVVPRTFNEDDDLNTMEFFCFGKGTEIETPSGVALVETLEIGDLVKTLDGGTTPVLWVGKQTIYPMFQRAERFQMVRVQAGAFGGGLPKRDLFVTADHAFLMDGLLINAGALVNGSTIVVMSKDELGQSIEVFHIETMDHQVILAEGVPAETFIDYEGRRGFDNYDEFTALYGKDRVVPEMPYPRVSAARMVPGHIKNRLGTSDAA